jgi:membrane protein YqaA with SNARE-associated domain
MFDRLYRWVLNLAASPHAEWALMAISFSEASFFPLPPETILVPMVIAQRDRAWRFALICTVSSILGGLLGYAIGALMYDTVGQWLINLYGLQQKAAQFHDLYARWGLWVILLKGLSPIPFKLVTIVSGIAHFNLEIFVAAVAVTRGLRFFMIAALLRVYGQPIQDFIERRLTLVVLAILAAIIGGYALLRYL